MSKPNVVNPFAVPVDTPVPEVRWGIAASAPPVDPSEIETTQRAAEVAILWGDEVLHVTHVSPLRDVVIGEGATDYLVGRELLGVERLPVVVEREGRLSCVVPEGARGTVTIGESTRSLAELDAEGKLAPFADVAGAKLYALPDGASARVEHRGLSFLVRPTNAARPVGAQQPMRLKHTGWIGLSLAVHAGFLVMFYFMPPHTSALSLDDTAVRDRLISYLETADAVQEPEPEWTEQASAEQAGGDGQRHDGEEGASGDPEERPSRGRFGVQGDPNDPHPELARERIRESMDSIAAIGTVRQLVGSWNTPTSPYGADQAHGNDPMSAIGALMGDQIAGNQGMFGLGMRGTGRGAGGFGQGTIGLGNLNTIGHGAGCEPGQHCRGGYGHGAGDLGGRTSRPGPTVRTVAAHVMGGLSQEAIRRVVHRHLPEVRFCYEQGLQQNPSLEGRVTVSWIIDPSGRVQTSSVASSSLSNGAVESCIATAVRRWTFPTPENHGTVGVNYPFVLQSNN